MSSKFQRLVHKIVAAVSPALISAVHVSSPALVPVTTSPALIPATISQPAKLYGFRFAHSVAGNHDVQSKAAHVSEIKSEEDGVVFEFVHYSSEQSILLVGDGDFSFALCLVTNLNNASKIVATALDTEDDLRTKYEDSKALQSITCIESAGAKVLLGVDAKTMATDPRLHLQVFDRIVFNLPHAGFPNDYKEGDARMIGMHQDLVSGFFGNGSKMLKPDGEIHLTHQTTGAFAKWNIEELATKAGLKLLRKVEFKLDAYHGYRHKCGAGSTPDRSFKLGPCATYMFGKEQVKNAG